MNAGGGSVPPLDLLLESIVQVKSRPGPLPPELRPFWRVPLLLLIVDKCRRGSATWRQIHVLSWALRDGSTRQAFRELVAGTLSPEDTIIRYEPGLNRAIDLAVGNELLTWKGRRLELTELGRLAVQRLNEADAFADERMTLATVTGKVTQTLIDRLIVARRA
jgi:hypothetical protein